MKYYYCLQLFSFDCGFACLKSMLSYFHKDSSYLYLDQCKKDKKYSLLDLERVALDHGLVLESYYIDDLNQINKFPCMYLLNNNNENHFIVIKGINKGNVYLFDPKLGERIIDISVLNNNEKKVVTLVKEVKKDNYKYKDKNNILIYQLFLIVSKFIEVFLLFLISFELPTIELKVICYTICFIILKLINVIFNIIYMKYYDKKQIMPYLDNENKLFIENEFILKKKLFSYYNKLYSSISLVIILLMILLINDLKHIFILSGCYIIYFIISKFGKDKNLLLKEKINYLESLNTKEGYIQANKLSYKYAGNEVDKDIIMTILICSLVVILCKINNNYNPLLIYTIMYFIMFMEIKKISSLYNSKLELNKSKQIHKLNIDSNS